MNNKEKIAQIKINYESYVNASRYYVQMHMEKVDPENAERISQKFLDYYKGLIEKNTHDEMNDLEKFYKAIQLYKQALTAIVQPGKDFDILCDLALQSFNVPLNRIRNQINDGAGGRNSPSMKRSGPILPPSPSTMSLSFFCAKCKEEQEIDLTLQKEILHGKEDFERPEHCEQLMEVKISRVNTEAPKTAADKKEEKIVIYPAELLMGHLDSTESNVEYMEVKSVGIDVGSSTSHLVFSKLTLKREMSFFNMTNRFNLTNREIIYEGNIIMTPLIDKTTIDVDELVKFFEGEYENAGLSPQDIDTGAVIVTGETAKKENADEIVSRLSSESGKFVSATAGPNFESLLGIMGSGVVKQSLDSQQTFMNVDVGGGTSNIAITSKGQVTNCSCTNVGGRLLGIDENFKIWRIDGPCEFLMKELGMNYVIGDTIPKEDVRKIAHEFAKALVEVMKGPATTKIGKWLLMTDDIEITAPIEAYSISGGIAENIYSEDKAKVFYNDIGQYLAEEIVAQLKENKMPLIEPENKIRATVIGAGSFSLSISGSTCYHDKSITLPIKNVPVITVPIDMNKLFTKEQILKEQIAKALANFDMVEGEEVVALYFNTIINHRILPIFTQGLAKALPNSIANKKMILIILRFDGAKILGLTLIKETPLKENLLCLDELELETGDWIDIGEPLKGKDAFPVTIKSLVFNQNKPIELDESKKPVKKEFVFDPDKIKNSFKIFQDKHEGYDTLLVLNDDGGIELTTESDFCNPESAINLLNAWKAHSSSVEFMENRYPILRSEETGLAAGSKNTNGFLIGSKTKYNRYVIVKITKGSNEWTPNVASTAVFDVNEWCWDLI